MKADRFGTWTQQVMFRQGYLTSKQRQAAGIYGQKCINCAAMIPAIGSKNPSCSLGRFVTTPNATCDQWKEAPKFRLLHQG